MIVNNGFDYIDLQLFNPDDEEEEEELEDGGYTGSDDEEDQEDEEESEDQDEEDQEGQEEEEEESESEEDEEEEASTKNKPGKKKDKVTNALIAEKRKNKELERRIQQIEDQKAEEARKVADEQRVKDLVKEGYGEAQAKAMVAQDSRLAKLEYENQKLKFQSMEKKHPGITLHMREIIDIQTKSQGLLSIEEIYNAKFRTSSEYDTKTAAEAAAVHRMRAGQQKKGAGSSGGSSKKSVKLSPAEEKMYQFLKSQKATNSLTRETFKKSLRGGDIE